jgi:hypothetical protein
MRALRLASAAAIAMAAMSVPAFAAGTHVSINSWHIYTLDKKRHKAKPGDTFKTCASNTAYELDAKGQVTGAKKGTAFQEIWTVNGKPDSVFNASWSRGGSFTDYFSIVAQDGSLKTGTWKLKLVQGAKTIGKSSITIRTKHGC